MTFESWKADFLSRAAGTCSDATLARCAPLMRTNATSTTSDETQAEARKTLRQYLDLTVSDARIQAGRTQLNTHRDTFMTLEHRFGVDRHIIAAIWGMETNFGQILGSVSVFEALSTLAHSGRRRPLFEGQLLAALKIVDHQLMDPAEMMGSWAGAMGHTQFMPTSYLDYAVGFDGPVADICGTDPKDALASTANYLAEQGWMDAPWAVEVSFPAELDLHWARHHPEQLLDDWAAQGVRPYVVSPSPSLQQAQLAFILPAGHRGPAFLASANYRALLAYNNAPAYAVAVGHLADRLRGDGPLKSPGDPDEPGLTQAQVIQAQTVLSDLGFDTQGADGFIGTNTVKALEKFQIQNGLPVDGHLDHRLHQTLLSFV